MKLALAFLGGTTFATATIVMAGGRASAMLGLGVLLTVSLSAGILRVVGVRRFARFLNAFMDSVDHISASSVPGTALPVETVRQSAPVPVVDELADDVTSALVNQGTPEKTARRAATEAVKTNRDFDPAYRAALELLPSRVKKAKVA